MSLSGITRFFFPAPPPPVAPICEAHSVKGKVLRFGSFGRGDIGTGFTCLLENNARPFRIDSIGHPDGLELTQPGDDVEIFINDQNKVVLAINRTVRALLPPTRVAD
jgi:hypothetical protein